MATAIRDGVSLQHNRKLFESFSENSLFSVFRSDEQIFDTLKLETLEQLLKQGADVNEVDAEYKMNFLQRLIFEEFSFETTEGEEFKKIAEFLYSNGIDVNHQDVHGLTALHLAASEDDFLLLKWLLDKGANLSIVDEDGETAFDYVNDFKPPMMSESYAADRKEALALLQIRK